MKNIFIMKCFLMVVILATSNYIHTQELKCLSAKENEYVRYLYSVFEKRLIDRYGKQKTHKLIYNYMNDLSLGKIDASFFESVQIDTTSKEFHHMFIRESQLPPVDFFLDDGVIEEEIIPVDENYEATEDHLKKEITNKQFKDHYVINPASTYALCFLQKKSRNYKINNLFQLFTVDNISPSVIIPGIISCFKEKEYEDFLLQIYIMYHLFLLPSLA